KQADEGYAKFISEKFKQALTIKKNITMENSEHNKVSIIDEQESLQIYGGLLTEVIAGILLTYALAEYPDITIY
ncbi:hypothetical protein, partial [Parabacteroides merdae]